MNKIKFTDRHPEREHLAIPAGESTELNIIRTETVFSRLPIHQLSKRGRIEIRIIRRQRAGGQISLYWRVSPNPEFGEPRQLAYKLDTLIVNRRLDDLGRPVPRIIRMGSLHSIAEKLGLSRNTDLVKNIFRQNALVGITARTTYRNRDGKEESIDATFTRYNVVFRGQQLPNGTMAETVYLILNDPYFQVVNNSVARPQDYDYLAALPPAAQRFYELVSFKMFAALKNGYPKAKLAYSDFCTAAPQTRYFDYEHFKKQMYKVHRPHVASGYLASVEYDRVTDAEGRGDWLMLYAPGPKARAEFRSFSRSRAGQPSFGDHRFQDLKRRPIGYDTAQIGKRDIARNHEQHERDYAASISQAEQRLTALKPDQYGDLYERVKAELTAQYRSVVRWKGPGVLDGMIKLKMAERLNNRPEKAA